MYRAIREIVYTEWNRRKQRKKKTRKERNYDTLRSWLCVCMGDGFLYQAARLCGRVNGVWENCFLLLLPGCIFFLIFHLDLCGVSAGKMYHDDACVCVAFKIYPHAILLTYLIDSDCKSLNPQHRPRQVSRAYFMDPFSFLGQICSAVFKGFLLRSKYHRSFSQQRAFDVRIWKARV